MEVGSSGEANLFTAPTLPGRLVSVMPNTSSAKKALLQDRRRSIENARVRTALKRSLKTVTTETLSQTVSAIDKAVKHHLIHRNKAARLKSQLAKSIGVATAKRPGAGTVTKAAPTSPVATAGHSKTATKKPAKAAKK